MRFICLPLGANRVDYGLKGCMNLQHEQNNITACYIVVQD
jgi:hypothetical protein